jgi:aromatic ring-opening dioxygenase LigB subunit
MAGLVIAAIAPHGGIAVPEYCQTVEVEIAAATCAGLEELGRRFEAAAPEAAVVITPHNVHVEGTFAVIAAKEVAGSIEEDERTMMPLACPVDLDLAIGLRDELRRAGVPVAGVSFGSNRLHEASAPLDWGALIPLWFMGGRWDPPLPVVVVAPARDLAAEVHVAAGRAIEQLAAASGKRVALIASADHGHAHDENGPYGFSPASAAYDEQVVAATRSNRLDRLLDLDPAFVDEAQADSWWQMLVLHGAIADRFDVAVLSYEAPTYFGMMCACFTPSAASPNVSPETPRARRRTIPAALRPGAAQRPRSAAST